jgi:hypothetical protein
MITNSCSGEDERHDVVGFFQTSLTSKLMADMLQTLLDAEAFGPPHTHEDGTVSCVIARPSLNSLAAAKLSKPWNNSVHRTSTIERCLPSCLPKEWQRTFSKSQKRKLPAYSAATNTVKEKTSAQRYYAIPVSAPSGRLTGKLLAKSFHITVSICSFSAVQCSFSAVQCRFSAVQCSAVQCSAVQCSAVQCSAVQCSAV